MGDWLFSFLASLASSNAWRQQREERRVGLAERSVGPVVWIVDSQHWPRVYLRAELIERGVEAVGFVSPKHAVAALRNSRQPWPQLIVLELRSLLDQPRELDVLLHAKVPIVALGGAIELGQEWVQVFDWATILRRPFAIGDAADVVEQLVEKRKRQQSASDSKESMI
jgi:DNA-binding NtrC family response regulator